MTDPRRLVPRTDAVLADPRLDGALGRLGRALVKEAVIAAQQDVRSGALAPDELVPAVLDRLPAVPASLRPVRSEERRVGKECERLCRSRWSPYH